MIVGCKIRITKVLDKSFYPGLCEVELEDYNGNKHYIVDKPPIFGLELKDIAELPCEAIMRAELLKKMDDWAEINTEIPDHIESKDGIYKFMVPKELIYKID